MPNSSTIVVLTEKNPYRHSLRKVHVTSTDADEIVFTRLALVARRSTAGQVTAQLSDGRTARANIVTSRQPRP